MNQTNMKRYQDKSLPSFPSRAKAHKSFATIKNEYAFFESHSTERAIGAEALCNSIVNYLLKMPVKPKNLRILDFGSGSGKFTLEVLNKVAYELAKLAIKGQNPSLLVDGVDLVLFEPDPIYLREGIAAINGIEISSLGTIRARPASTWDDLKSNVKFDLILANHSLYYVENISETLNNMFMRLTKGGSILLSIATKSNGLAIGCQEGFMNHGESAPFHFAEDVSDVLEKLLSIESIDKKSASSKFHRPLKKALKQMKPQDFAHDLPGRIKNSLQKPITSDPFTWHTTSLTSFLIFEPSGPTSRYLTKFVFGNHFKRLNANLLAKIWDQFKHEIGGCRVCCVPLIDQLFVISKRSE